MKVEDLYSLGAIVEERNYKYGEILVGEGKIPDGMFIVVEGDCQVCLDEEKKIKEQLFPSTQFYINFVDLRVCRSNLRRSSSAISSQYVLDLIN